MNIFVKYDKSLHFLYNIKERFGTNVILFTSPFEQIDIKENDVLIIHSNEDYLEILNIPKFNIKLTILSFLSQEGTNAHWRKYIMDKNPLHRILFSTCHLDRETIEHDLSFKIKLFAFRDTAFNQQFSDYGFLNENLNKKRSKTLNFFNRTINLRRLKAFELVKKRNIDLSNSYNTFAFVMMDNVFGGIRKISQYIDRIKSYSSVYKAFESNLDIEYIESKENEFICYEDREWHCVTLHNIQELNDIININSLDSYASFVIESSNETNEDNRFTEKTIRTFLLKNIGLFLNVKGYNNLLRLHGIQTFEDIFGLEADWDECGELERVTRFIDALEKFNTVSIEDVEKIYFSESVQQRLNINFEIIKEAFTNENLFLSELLNKIDYKQNLL